LLTTRFCKERPVIVEGMEPPNPEFLISVRLFIFVKDEKRLSGRADMAVDSRCRVDIADRFVKDVGSDPPGMAPLPITWKVCRSWRLPTWLGMDAGTAGKVN